jgi:hypothetical protein
MIQLSDTLIHVPANVFPVIQSHRSNRLWCGLAGEVEGSAASEGCQCSSSYYLEQKHLITPQSRDLLEKPIAPQLVKKFPAFY